MKKIEEEIWGGFAYPLQLAAKELLTKANPYKDVAGRFTSANNAVAPKGKRPKLKRGSSSTKKEKVLNPIKNAMSKESITNDDYTPSALIKAGIISEAADLSVVWTEITDIKALDFLDTEVIALVRVGNFDEAFRKVPARGKSKILKMLVVRTIGKTLEEKFTPEELSEFLYGTRDVQGKVEGKDVVQKVLNTWADSSGEDISIHLGEAARKLFDAEGVLANLREEQTAREYNNNVLGTASITRRVTQAVAQTMYDNTQKYLQSLGVTEAILSRGTSRETIGRDYTTDNPLTVGKETVVQRPIASWSLDGFTAIDFSQDGYGVVIEAKIPAKQVFSTPLTGIGCFSESEFVVLSPSSGNRIVTTDYAEEEEVA